MLKVNTWEPTEHTLGDATIRFKVKRLNFLEGKAFQSMANRMRLDIPGTIARLFAAVTLAEQRVIGRRLKAALDAAGVALPPLDFKPNDKGEPTVTQEQALINAAAPLFDQHGIEIPIPSGEQMLDDLRDQAPVLDEIRKLNEQFFDSLDTTWAAEVFAKYVQDVEGLEVDGQVVTDGAALYEVADRELVMLVLERVRVLCELSNQAKKTSSLPPTSAPEARTSGGSETAEPAVSVDGPPSETATVIPLPTGSSSKSEADPASTLVSP